MKVEIISIGDELMLGFTTDTNASFLSRELAALGVEVTRRTTVGDDLAAIGREVQDALQRSGGVITSGGLGPTSDDVSRDAVALAFGRDLVEDADALREIEALFRRRGAPSMASTNRRQALLPRGATALRNSYGTAPGIWIEDHSIGWVAMLPGVPRELRGMFGDEVRPRLISRGGGVRPILSRTLRTTGIAESALAELIEKSGEVIPGLAYLPGVEGVDLRVTLRDAGDEDPVATLGSRLAVLRRIAGRHAYAEGDTDLAEVVLRMARERQMRIAVAESCTGGMIGERLSGIPGASDVFAGGVISYANEVKVALLGVHQHVLDTYGAVSAETVELMARGARDRTGATIGIAVSGIAGPGGGSEAKPVGTVWVCVDVDGAARAEHRVLPGDREDIRRRAAQMALNMVRLGLSQWGR